MTDAELTVLLEDLRATMTAVATGGPQIATVNDEYRARYGKAAAGLAERGIPNPVRFADLWDWYGHWRAAGMSTYQSRREYLGGVFNPLIERLATGRLEEYEATGWERVDRALVTATSDLGGAANEEQFQVIGLTCREATISLAQAVFDPDRHPILDGVEVSRTDAKRMLEAYMAVELAGERCDYLRAVVRATFNLANNVQHRRNADYRDAAICLEATKSLVNLIALHADRRNHNAYG